MTTAVGSLILLIFVNALTVASGAEDVSQNICNEETFSKPYVLLRTSRRGQVAGKMETQGMVDCRDYQSAFVCINGAAIIYNLYEDNYPRFSGGSLQVFNHTCLPLNWQTQRNKRVQSGQGTFSEVTPSSAGIQAKGIFLIAPDESSTSPSDIKVMFTDIDFNYKIGPLENIVSDSSFVAAGKGPYCLEALDGSLTVLKTGARDNGEVCKWTPKNLRTSENKKYKQIFQRKLNRQDYKWVECPPDVSTSDNSDEAGKDITKPFATYKKASVEMLGPESGSDGGPNEEVQLDGGGPTEENGGSPRKIFTITLENCLSLPKYDASHPECAFANAKCEDMDKLNAALGKEEEKAASESGEKEDDTLHWKREVLSLVASIFSKICLPIKRHSVYRLMKIVEKYIVRAHSDSSDFDRFTQKSNLWEILIVNLKKCNDHKKTKPMEWDWSGEMLQPLVPSQDMGNVPMQKRDSASETFSHLSENQPDIDQPEFDSAEKLKRENFDISNLEKSLLDAFSLTGNEGDEDNEEKLIIQRSPPEYQPDDDGDDSTNQFIHGTLPRWRRADELEQLPLPFIQEYVPPLRKESAHPVHEDFMFFPGPQLRIKSRPEREIFFYNEWAELVYDLNPIIDAFWKVLSTVMGYCRVHDMSRGQGLFSLLYHNFNGYFLDVIKEDWKHPILKEVEMLAGEFLDEDRSRWLDACLETAYIISDSLHLRPTRPLDYEVADDSGKVGEYDAERKLTANNYISTPEDFDGGTEKYFVRKFLPAQETAQTVTMERVEGKTKQRT